MIRKFIKKHIILFNILLMIVIAVLGIVIAITALSLFTKHGQSQTVPKVENMSYTDAINKLRDAGFKVEISDSVYRADVKPGYVLEQTPKANTNVKPGRVIYLVINAVSPKQVTIANMQGVSLRQAKAVLEGMGFKNISVVYKLGKYRDIVLSIKANGREIRSGQKVSINTPIVIEVSNGRIDSLADSLLNAEYGSSNAYGDYGEGEYNTDIPGGTVTTTEEGGEGESSNENYEEIDPYAGREKSNSQSE